MEEETEVVPRALSTAKFLMTSHTSPSAQETKEKQVWDAANRKVITVIETVQAKDLACSSAELWRFLPWSTSPNKSPDTSADGTKTSMGPSGTNSPTSRSRRGSTLFRTIDEWQPSSPKLSDAGSDDSGDYEGTPKPRVSHGRRRQSSLLMNEQYSGDLSVLDPAAPGSLMPRGSWGSSAVSSRRSSALMTQEQARRLTTMDPLIDAAVAVGASMSPQSALASKARRSSMTVVDLQRPTYLGGSDTLAPQTKSANGKQARRGSLPFIPNEFETRMSQLVLSLSPSAATAAATAAAATAVSNETSPSEVQQHSSLRPDRRSRSLDTLWEQMNVPAAAQGLAVARPASEYPRSPQQSSPKSQQSSPKSQMHSAASLASVARRNTYDVAAAASKVAPLPLHLLADPNHSYHKAKTTPFPAGNHSHKADSVNRSKSGFSYNGAGNTGFSTDGGDEWETDDSKSGAETVRRYVPEIHKIDKLALQRGGEWDCTAYDSLLDAKIAQGLRDM